MKQYIKTAAHYLNSRPPTSPPYVPQWTDQRTGKIPSTVEQDKTQISGAYIGDCLLRTLRQKMGTADLERPFPAVCRQHRLPKPAILRLQTLQPHAHSCAQCQSKTSTWAGHVENQMMDKVYVQIQAEYLRDVADVIDAALFS